MDKETLIKIAEELHHGAFDANADYLILQQYRKNQREYAEEMRISPGVLSDNPRSPDESLFYGDCQTV